MPCIAINRTNQQQALAAVTEAESYFREIANSKRFALSPIDLPEYTGPILTAGYVWNIASQAIENILNYPAIFFVSLTESFDTSRLKRLVANLHQANQDLQIFEKCPNELSSSYLVCFEEALLTDSITTIRSVAISAESFATNSYWTENYGINNLSATPLGPLLGINRTFWDAKEDLQKRIIQAATELAQVAKTLRYEQPCTHLSPLPPPPPSGDDCKNIADALLALSELDIDCLTEDRAMDMATQLAAAIADNYARIEESQTALAAMLDAINNHLHTLDRAIGIEDFGQEGVAVPAFFTDRDGGAIVRKKSIPQLVTWLALQLDSLMGQWPIKFKVEDTEADEEGQQEVNMEAPNLAEAMTELLGLCLNTDIQADAILNATMRQSAEILLIRQQGVKTHYNSEALIEWLGFEVNERSIDLPVLINRRGSKISEVLKEATEKVVVADLASRESLFSEILAELLNGPAILRAVFANALPRDPALAKQEISSKISNLTDPNDEDDFDTFVNKVQEGFINEPGMIDPVNPYGRKYSSRPRIRQVGQDGDALEDLP